MDTTITDGQLINTLTLLKQKGVTPDGYQQLLESGILADIVGMHPKWSDGAFRHLSELRLEIRALLRLDMVEIEVEVDYARTIADAIASCWLNKITNWGRVMKRLAGYSIVPAGASRKKVIFSAIEVENWETRDEALVFLTKNNVRSATPLELFAFDHEHYRVATEFGLYTWGEFIDGTGTSVGVSIIRTNYGQSGFCRELFFHKREFPDSYDHPGRGKMLVVHN